MNSNERIFFMDGSFCDVGGAARDKPRRSAVQSTLSDGNDMFSNESLQCLPESRIERVAQPVSEQVYREHEHHQRDAGKDRNPPLSRKKEFCSYPDQSAERGSRRWHTNSEKGKSRL